MDTLRYRKLTPAEKSTPGSAGFKARRQAEGMFYHMKVHNFGSSTKSLAATAERDFRRHQERQKENTTYMILNFRNEYEDEERPLESDDKTILYSSNQEKY